MATKKIKKDISVVEKKPRSTQKLFLTREQEVEIFKHLIDKTAIEVCALYGIDKILTSPGTQRLTVYNICKKIKKAPELYGLSQDAVDIVQASIDSRIISKKPNLVKEREKEEFKDKLEDIRDTAVDILSKKLSLINRNKNTIMDVKLKDISDILAMSIDKIRLTKGESTETVVHLSKMSLQDVTPEQAMELVLKAREALVEGKK
jgi:hypothetical protein